jgi:hypothetical protein
VSLALASLAAAAGADTGLPPSAVTEPAAPVGQTTATVAARVDPNGSATMYHFEYGTTAAYGAKTADESAGSADGDASVQLTLSSLSPNTTYHYRVVAKNDAGETLGEDATFQTAAPTQKPTPPGVTTGTARGTTTSVTLVGRVDPNNSETRVWFEYGPSAVYDSRTPEVEVSGDGARAITSSLGDLAPNTTLHYRIVAANAAGRRAGRDRIVRTLHAPTGVSLVPPTTAVPFRKPVVMTGIVAGEGVGGVRVSLELQPWPFSGPFTRVNTVRAKADGTFQMTTPPMLASTRMRAVTPTVMSAASPVVTVWSSVLVDARADRRRARRVRISGRVMPGVSRARASLQRRGRHSKWTLVRRTTTSRPRHGTSNYSLTVRRAQTTRTYRVVVIPPRHSAHVRGVSNTVTVRRAPR